MSSGPTDDEEFPATARPLGWLMAALVTARRRRAMGRRLVAPVISVGNLVVGGAGKTPLVREIAGWLAEAGRRVAILSRGYARPMPVPGTTRVSREGRMELLRWEHAGDEPWMLARALPRASVYVGADRVEAGEQALLDGADTLLLDDGFQHLGLARDLDIVCVRGDEARLRVMPAGPLREPVSALRDADVVVRIVPAAPAPAGAGGYDAEDTAGLRSRLREGAAWIVARAAPGRLLLADGGVATAESLAGQRVGILCAIARPHRLVEAVAALGARIEAVHTRRDHHVFGEAELANLRSDLLWVTTAKDQVRLAG